MICYMQLHYKCSNLSQLYVEEFLNKVVPVGLMMSDSMGSLNVTRIVRSKSNILIIYQQFTSISRNKNHLYPKASSLISSTVAALDIG